MSDGFDLNRREGFSVSPADGLERRRKILDYTKTFLQFFERQRNSFFQDSEGLSTNYASHWHAIAREFARFRLAIDDYYADQSVETVRRDFLFQKIGHYIKLDQELFPSADIEGEVSDERYRNFIFTLLKLFFQGSTKAAIETAADFYTELPIKVTELVRELGYDISHQHMFTLDLDLDDATNMNISSLYGDLADIMRIITPAHVLTLIRFSFSDNFQFSLGCSPVYDLIEDEIVPEVITASYAGDYEIVSIDRNTLILDNGDKLFCTNTTIFQDGTEVPLTFNDLGVGEFISYVGYESPGRYQYYREEAVLPAAFFKSYLGFSREPLVTDLDPEVVAQTDFQFYVKKQFSNGFEKKTKNAEFALCEKVRGEGTHWMYEDFRKCYDGREAEAVTAESPYVQDATTILTLHGPLTQAGVVDPAEDPTDVTVRVNGTPVTVASLNPYKGEIVLTNPIDPNVDVVEVDYWWYDTPNYELLTDMDGTGTDYWGIPDVRFPHWALTDGAENSCDPETTSCSYQAWYHAGSSLTDDPETLLTDQAEGPRHRTDDAMIVSSAIYDQWHQFRDWRSRKITLKQGTPLLIFRFGDHPDVRLVFVDGSLLNHDHQLNDLFTLNNGITALATGSDIFKYANIELDCEYHHGRSRLTAMYHEELFELAATIKDQYEFPEEEKFLYTDDWQMLPDNIYTLGDAVNLGDPYLSLADDPDQQIPNVLGAGYARRFLSVTDDNPTWDPDAIMMRIEGNLKAQEAMRQIQAEDIQRIEAGVEDSVPVVASDGPVTINKTFYYSSRLNDHGNRLNEGFMLNITGADHWVWGTGTETIP